MQILFAFSNCSCVHPRLSNREKRKQPVRERYEQNQRSKQSDYIHCSCQSMNMGQKQYLIISFAFNTVLWSEAFLHHHKCDAKMKETIYLVPLQDPQMLVRRGSTLKKPQDELCLHSEAHIQTLLSLPSRTAHLKFDAALLDLKVEQGHQTNSYLKICSH